MKKIDVLILGDFPPKTYTGISIINDIILKILLESHINVVRLEDSFWMYSFIGKFSGYFRSSCKVLWLNIFNRVGILYFNIPLSISGLLKLDMILFLVRIISPRTILIGHLHRGDIRFFVERGRINKFLLRYCLGKVDKTIVLSEIYCEDVLKVNSTANPIVVYNTSSIETGIYASPNRDYNAKFLCISNYIRSKGIGELVEAFRLQELASMNLEVIGNIYDSDFYNDLKSKATTNITINKSLPNSDLKGKLLEADCFILPSWNEGQPLVLLEAMSMGIPIIASKVGDIPNMLGNNYPFLFTPKNIDELKSMVLNFSNYPSKFELGQKLFIKYNQKYSNRIFRDNVYKVFIG